MSEIRFYTSLAQQSARQKAEQPKPVIEPVTKHPVKSEESDPKAKEKDVYT